MKACEVIQIHHARTLFDIKLQGVCAAVNDQIEYSQAQGYLCLDHITLGLLFLFRG